MTLEMERNMKKTSLGNFAALAVVALVIAMMPTSAMADYISFTVDESSVPGAIPVSFEAEKLNGGYVEQISFTGTEFSAAALARFGQYFIGADTPESNLNNLGANGYALYATFYSTGVQNGNVFTGDWGEIRLFIDPNQDTVGTLGATGYDDITLVGNGDDYQIMWSDNLIKGVGQIFSADQGSFDFLFGDPILNDPEGLAYWPTLPQIYLQTVIDGDFDTFTPSGDVYVEGDVSARFQVVPEPSTLVLFGLGLIGTAVAIRRKR